MDKTQTKSAIPMKVFLLMASVTFMAILSEMIPSGILPQLQQGLNISEQEAGNLVGFYAIASACCGIPIISATVEWDRKKLLRLLLIGFAVANLCIGIIPNYYVTIICRIIGGICAGVLWPMIAAYGMKLVSEAEQGKTVAIIMAGTTVGMSLGLPAVTLIGTHLSWKLEFITIGILIALIAVLCEKYLPVTTGEKRTNANSPFTLIRNKGVLIIILLTFLSVVANYGVFTFITKLVTTVNYPSLSLAQLIFGIGSLVSVWFAGKFIDHHLEMVDIDMLAASAIAFVIFMWLSHLAFALHVAFFLWGIGFGALVTLYQTAVARQVHGTGTAVATSLQSACFNFSIMIATWTGGQLLVLGSIQSVLFCAFAALVIAVVVSVIFKAKLK